MIRLHNQNRTHTFIDVESGQFISLPKDLTDKPPVNADINGLQFFGKSTQDGEPTADNPVDIVNIPPEFNLTVCGKNLFNKETRTLSMWISRNGTTGSSEISDTTDYIRVEPNTNYFLSGHPNYTVQEIAFYDINRSIITELEGVRVAADNGLKTTPSNCYFIRFSMAKTDVDTIQFEKGSVATPYQPYQGSTYPYRIEDLDGVLHYGGDLPDGTADTYNRETGEFVKRIGVKVLDGTENWWAETNYDTATRVSFSVSLPYYTYDSSTYSKITHYRNTHFTKSATPLAGNLNDNVCRLTDRFYVAISKTLATDLATFKTWLAGQYSAGTPVTVQYALAEPVTYQIKQYGETYGGVVWEYNEKPKSIQYHTNIFTDKNIDMQCEVRKLGNRKMGEFYWVTENGDYIVTDDNDYIMLEY